MSFLSDSFRAIFGHEANNGSDDDLLCMSLVSPTGVQEEAQDAVGRSLSLDMTSIIMKPNRQAKFKKKIEIEEQKMKDLGLDPPLSVNDPPKLSNIQSLSTRSPIHSRTSAYKASNRNKNEHSINSSSKVVNDAESERHMKSRRKNAARSLPESQHPRRKTNKSQMSTTVPSRRFDNGYYATSRPTSSRGSEGRDPPPSTRYSPTVESSFLPEVKRKTKEIESTMTKISGSSATEKGEFGRSPSKVATTKNSLERQLQLRKKTRGSTNKTSSMAERRRRGAGSKSKRLALDKATQDRLVMEELNDLLFHLKIGRGGFEE